MQVGDTWHGKSHVDMINLALGADYAAYMPLHRAAQTVRRLRDGLTAEDCDGAYPLAAAWLVMDWVRGSRGLEGITSLTAGDISVRREGPEGSGGRLSQKALELMRPFLREEGFVFRGVSG